jgi:copper chaperone CopZ
MKAQKLGILSGVVASLCCLGQPLLIFLGLGTLGLGSFFGKYHWYFIGGGTLLLAFAWRAYFKEKRRCTTEGCQMVREGTTRSILLMASLIVVVFFGLNLFTYAGGRKEIILSQKTDEKQVVIPVEGMSCFTCELSVEKALNSVEGIQFSQASAQKGNVSILYDPGKVTVEDLVRTINKTGYKASFPKE